MTINNKLNAKLFKHCLKVVICISLLWIPGEAYQPVPSSQSPAVGTTALIETPVHSFEEPTGTTGPGFSASGAPFLIECKEESAWETQYNVKTWLK